MNCSSHWRISPGELWAKTDGTTINASLHRDRPGLTTALKKASRHCQPKRKNVVLKQSCIKYCFYTWYSNAPCLLGTAFINEFLMWYESVVYRTDLLTAAIVFLGCTVSCFPTVTLGSGAAKGTSVYSVWMTMMEQSKNMTNTDIHWKTNKLVYIKHSPCTTPACKRCLWICRQDCCSSKD